MSQRVRVGLPVLFLILFTPLISHGQGLRPAMLTAGAEPEKATEPKPDADAAATELQAKIKKLLDGLEAQINLTTPSVRDEQRTRLSTIMVQLSETLGTLREQARTQQPIAPSVTRIAETVGALQSLMADAGRAETGVTTAIAEIRTIVESVKALVGIVAKKEMPKIPETLALACDRLVLPPVPPPDRIPEIKELLDAVATEKGAVTTFGKDTGIDVTGLTDGADKRLALTGVCGAIWQKRVSFIEDTPAGHKDLVEIQLAVSRIRKWQEPLLKTAGAQPVATRAQRQLSNAKDAVDAQMRAHGLDRLVSAALFVGTMFGESGTTISPIEMPPATDAPPPVKLKASSATSLMSVLSIETKHWGAEGESPIDGSLRTIVGFRPVLVPLLISGVDSEAKTTSTTEDGTKTTVVTTTSSPLSPIVGTALQEALVFGFGGRVGAYNSRSMEVSFVAQGIATYLWDTKVLLESDNADTIVGVAANKTARTQWAGEMGAEFRLFDNPIRVAHAEGGMTSPALSVAIGYRHDSRLKAGGALAEPQFDLKNSERRYYVRVLWDPIKNIDQRAVAKPAKTFDIGIGVEVEWAAFGQGRTKIPPSTRFIIRGDINLLRAAAKGEDK